MQVDARERKATMRPEGIPRILLDLSWTARWSGPPVGILRVERELARYAFARPGTVGVFFDPASRRYLALPDATTQKFLAGDAVLDTLGIRDPGRAGKRKSEAIPAPLRPAARWLLQTRHMALQALERRRLDAATPAAAEAIDRLQRRLMSAKYRRFMVKPDGSRRDFLPLDRLAAKPVAFRPDDVLVCAGAGWSHTDIDAIVAQKRATPFRLVILCYDIIPILFPQFYKPHDVAGFTRYFDKALPAADLVVTNSHRVEADVQAHCRDKGLPLAATAVVPLGADVPASGTSAGTSAGALPQNLEAQKFALFVSTIEPRKGHRLLYETWLRLLADGVPQKTGFKLVFVGRAGWMVDDLVKALDTDPRIAGSLIRLEGLSDAAVRALYAGCAFCCYPSRYEGYGLPLVEAFHFGKAVVASTGGSLPEVAGPFSPCLDPDDADAWYRTLREWIENPAARAPYEARIRENFRHPSWDEAAADFFARLAPLLHETAAGPAPVA
ncbi:putative glycosyltransferase WbpX, putative [Rhodovulum sp. PH10]|uniref:glycosyltransferase family 4 protein n=1 Tax=Rhodovulum sp. PH10 TaxID=1187851 RepID=UPI00027C22DD|nr:glycosyltransferase family 1 protein [Rhodovulum sp. PH10]EJW13325.1 putative glycosyltransferase WbpX, putative [Rhodovulum sp. PH10]